MPKVALGFLAVFAAVCVLRLAIVTVSTSLPFALTRWRHALGNSLAMTPSITTVVPIAPSDVRSKNEIIRLFGIPDNEPQISEGASKAIDAKQGDANPACCIECTDDARVGRESACRCAEQRIARLHRQAAREYKGGEIQRVGPARRERELTGKRREQRDRERIGERQQEGSAKADASCMSALRRCALREPQADPDQGPLAGLERFDPQCLDGLEVFGIGGNDSEFVFDGGGGDEGIGEL